MVEPFERAAMKAAPVLVVLTLAIELATYANRCTINKIMRLPVRLSSANEPHVLTLRG